jgi:carbonic anhydrase
MGAIDELLGRHRAFDASSTTSSDGSDPRPRLGVAVVACMDARLDVGRVLGLRPGEAHVVRNAGGLVTDDVLRSLLVSQRLLGTEEVMVVMHTSCGMLGLSDAELAGQVTAETQVEPPFAFGGFDDLEAQLAHSLDAVRGCPWLPHRDAVRGFVYDVHTGLLHEPPVDADR